MGLVPLVWSQSHTVCRYLATPADFPKGRRRPSYQVVQIGHVGGRVFYHLKIWNKNWKLGFGCWLMLRSIFLQALLSCHGYQNTHCAQHEIDTASFYSVPCSHHHTVHLLERKHMLQTTHSHTLSHILTSRDDMDCQGVAIVLAIPELCTKLFRVYKPEAVPR